MTGGASCIYKVSLNFDAKDARPNTRANIWHGASSYIASTSAASAVPPMPSVCRWSRLNWSTGNWYQRGRIEPGQARSPGPPSRGARPRLGDQTGDWRLETGPDVSSFSRRLESRPRVSLFPSNLVSRAIRRTWSRFSSSWPPSCFWRI